MKGSGGVELVWPGKYDGQGCRSAVPRLSPQPNVDARYPADDDEPSSGPAAPGWCDRLLLGDNLAGLEALLCDHAGEVDLVYIDPPFATGGNYAVSTRVGEGEDGRPPPEVSAPAYSDRWDGGPAGFLAMLDPRLRRVRELLAPHGSLYIHVDPTVGHAVKLLADEIFGPEAFQREIVWRIGWVSGFKTRARNWIRNHDLLFFYTKDPKRFTFNKIYVPYPEGYRRRDGSPPKGEGMPIEDVWNAAPAEFELRGRESLDSIQIKSFSTEKTGYATQKNESLLRRVVSASSNPGDLVADVFCGSGTTAVVASELGRRFIGCDASAPAVHIATKRLLAQARAHPLRVETLEPWERQRCYHALGQDQQLVLEHHSASPRAHRKLVLAHHGAQALGDRSDAPLLHGRRGSAVVHVVPPDAPLDDHRLASVIAAARTGGCKRLHVIADAFDLPLRRSPVPDLDLTLLRIGREILDPRCREQRDVALHELPRVTLQVEGLEGGGIHLRLVDYDYPHPKRLPADVRKVVRRFSDFIDAWSVQWNADGSVHAPDVARFRTHNARALELEAGPHRPLGKGPWRTRVRLHDVLHQRVEIELELRRRDGGLELAAARQR